MLMKIEMWRKSWCAGAFGPRQLAVIGFIKGSYSGAAKTKKEMEQANDPLNIKVNVLQSGSNK